MCPVCTIVTETIQIYNCTEELHHVESEYAMQNPDCDQYWSAQDHSIGTFLRSTPECHSPCKELFLGRIILTECLNITLAVICSKDHLTERRVHFYGLVRMVPQPLHNPVKRDRFGIFLAIALLVTAVAGLLGAGCANKNNRRKLLPKMRDEESLQ